MTDTLTRIIEYPTRSVFDKDPKAVLALRVRHPDGLTWRVQGGRLTLTAGTQVNHYRLADYTIAQLADALQADGFELPFENPDMGSRGAFTLLRGTKSQGETNGDHLLAYTSLLWALYDAFGAELDEQSEQVIQALRQMVLPDAEGFWLDVWGTLYGVARYPSETDGHFAERIPDEVFRLRVNAHAIEQVILDLTGYNVRIHEPWKDLFTLDRSLLSGHHRLYDGVRYGYHLIQPEATTDVDWQEVIPVIERNRAAGVQQIAPMVYRSAYLDASDHELDGGTTAFRYGRAVYEDRALLDMNLGLSDNSWIILNYEASKRRERMLSSGPLDVAMQDWGGDTVYVAYRVNATRDYRAFYFDVVYAGPVWLENRTWNTINLSWDDPYVLLDSAHTRS